MAKSREIVKRRKSVSNIRKITRTMEMIATAKFKRSFDRAVGTRPYSEKISQLVATLAGGGGNEHSLLAENQTSKRTVLLVLTSNRGLCGGYNGSLLRLASAEIKKLKSQGQEVDVRVSGKKGIAYFNFIKQPVSQRYTEFDDKTGYGAVETLANEYIDLYTQQQIDAVRIVYMRFVSTSKHYADVLNLLPLTSLETQETKGTSVNLENYIFSPEPEEILNALIPTTVRIRLFQCFLDAIVSEQIARMAAMKAATDNAEKMIKTLTRQYNRARQSQITNELLDIMGGVEAMN